ncbi:MAG: heavy-metal-associated domain-containing protein [Planctomycetales bacterium]
MAKNVLLWAVLMLLTADAASAALILVTVEGVHLCCPSCVKAAHKAASSVEGVSVGVHAKKRTIHLTSSHPKAVQQSLAALAAAGFHGKSSQAGIVFKNDGGAKPGKVRRAEFIGIHNCCGGCTRAIKQAVGSVEGVVADTVKPNSRSFVVEGDFEPAAVIQALNAAGFHARIKP